MVIIDVRVKLGASPKAMSGMLGRRSAAVVARKTANMADRPRPSLALGDLRDSNGWAENFHTRKDQSSRLDAHQLARERPQLAL